MICSCGSNRFLAHQLLRVNVIVDEHGEFEADLPEGLESSIYDSETPYGPFVCTSCGKEYDVLADRK